MTSPWVPFDADEDEVASLHVIREGIPSPLRPVLLAWIFDRMPIAPYSGGQTTAEFIHLLQSALRLDFELGPKETPDREWVLDFLEEEGDRTVLRVIDFLASTFSAAGWGMPDEIERLRFHLDTAMSAFEIYLTDEGFYRLRHRLPEGVEEAVQSAIDLNARAGRHLANAWRNAFALEPNESFAMTEAIRAVEAACGPVVIPNDKKPSLGKVVSALGNQQGWGLVLRNSDGFPDHNQVLIGMMETLAKAQPDRHAGDKPSALEAQAHVQLAATLVHWFASGAVVKAEGQP